MPLAPHHEPIEQIVLGFTRLGIECRASSSRIPLLPRDVDHFRVPHRIERKTREPFGYESLAKVVCHYDAPEGNGDRWHEWTASGYQDSWLALSALLSEPVPQNIPVVAPRRRSTFKLVEG